MDLHLSTGNKHFLIALSSKKISVLNETIINIMSNYIPNKTMVFDAQNTSSTNAEIENLTIAEKEAKNI